MYTQLKQTTFFHKIDLIIPVPVSKERLKERGYNQAEELARHLSKISEIPYNKDILVRCKDTKPQSGFSQVQRSNNIKGAFKCISGLSKMDKVILIVDDIYTTGSTINECAKVLKESGPHKVYSSVVCIGNLNS